MGWVVEGCGVSPQSISRGMTGPASWPWMVTIRQFRVSPAGVRESEWIRPLRPVEDMASTADSAPSERAT